MLIFNRAYVYHFQHHSLASWHVTSFFLAYCKEVQLWLNVISIKAILSIKTK